MSQTLRSILLGVQAAVEAIPLASLYAATGFPKRTLVYAPQLVEIEDASQAEQIERRFTLGMEDGERAPDYGSRGQFETTILLSVGYFYGQNADEAVYRAHADKPLIQARLDNVEAWSPAYPAGMLHLRWSGMSAPEEIGSYSISVTHRIECTWMEV